jgi:aryl-alcohol dehydrogenase-like predicted oxidoreductase
MSDASQSGTYSIGGALKVHRLGFGAMRVTGRGIWGEPADRAEALRVLRRLPELGVDFVDTADSYGPDVSELIIREALHPYPGMVIATKGGLTRTGPNLWTPLGRPEYLIQQALKSRRNLGVETIDLWQLHRIDPKTPRDEQFAAVKSLIDAKVIRFAGLSNVSVADIEAAAKVFPVATVQNRYSLADRGSEDVLDHCQKRHRLHPVVPARRGRARRAGLDPGGDGARPRRDAGTGRARLAAEAQPGHSADPRHLQGRPPRGERRGGGLEPVRRRIRRVG